MNKGQGKREKEKDKTGPIILRPLPLPFPFCLLPFPCPFLELHPQLSHHLSFDDVAEDVLLDGLIGEVGRLD